MEKIIFSTNNRHKLEEVRQILNERYEVLGLKELGFEGDIPETGLTLEENALIKSRFVNNHFGMDCFSDDTGLEIDALDGKPGVFSARYAGEEGNEDKNVRKVLNELNGIQQRTARFRTVVSLILGGQEHSFEGIVEGRIIDVKRGRGGFGYDPIFIPDGHTETFAEMPPGLKNEISHRGRAIRKLADFLKEVTLK